MDTSLFKDLHNKGFINAESLTNVYECEQKKIISVHWDLKTILYAGILLLTAGLGILIYKNIDTIGHLAILIFIASASFICFAYCVKKAKGYYAYKIEAPNVWFDYVLLLGCLLLLIFVGYLQFQYEVFGSRWGMATFIPMVVLFFAAYYFDHLGKLSLAITNLAAWLGITVTPRHLLLESDFSTPRIIYSGLLLGVFLMALAFFSVYKNIKAHFSFTYKNFGAHILFISCLAAVMNFDTYYLLWFLVLAGAAFYNYTAARKEGSFYFLMITTLYFYIGMTYVVIRLLWKVDLGEGAIYLALFYLISSAVALIFFLIDQNKLIRKDVRIQ